MPKAAFEDRRFEPARFGPLRYGTRLPLSDYGSGREERSAIVGKADRINILED
jgi:hypothetical protein